jgi:hypothetical protein
MKNKRKNTPYHNIENIVFKCAFTEEAEPVIIALGIPKGAERITDKETRKSRTSMAYTLAISPLSECLGTVKIESNQLLETARSWHDSQYKYRVGECQVPTLPFDANSAYVCRSGIHYFIDARDAVYYMTSDMSNHMCKATHIHGAPKFYAVATKELGRQANSSISPT